MKYLLDELKEIEAILNNKRIGLFLDFDGTLASIKKTPQEAYLPLKTKKLLISLKNNPQIFLTIISGRGLGDLKNKINIPGIVYVGNHGLEWEINGERKSAHIDEKILQALFCIRSRMRKLEQKFKGIFAEDKGLTIGVHYRLLKRGIANFKKEFAEIINPYLSDHKLVAIKGKKVFDIRPDVNWTKGHFSKFIIDKISKKKKSEIITIYIGDDKTDEDAFLHLKKEITIRVGSNSKSHAKYYVRDTAEVIKVLKWLLNSGGSSLS